MASRVKENLQRAYTAKAKVHSAGLLFVV